MSDQLPLPAGSASPDSRAQRSPGTRERLLLVALMVAAVAVRLYRVNVPPLDFHATRQYRSLLIARGFYFAGQDPIPEWQRRVADLNLERQGFLEPPVGESLAAAGYHVTGGESYWLPRSLSIVFWTVGAIALYNIARRILNEAAGLFAVAIYLFIPFAVVASRSFQPDPLMVMLTLGAILALLRHHDRPATRRLLAAAGLSALAIFVKPISMFIVVAVFAGLAIQRQGFKATVTSPATWLYAGITALPAVSYYLIYGLVLSDRLDIQAQASFLPQLLLDPFFWRGWLDNVRVVVGFPALIVSLWGTFLFPRGVPRTVISSLWIGYGIFCLAFNYHISTHDYYHLVLIPIVALSLGAVLATIFERAWLINTDRSSRLAIAGILSIGLLLAVLSSRPQLMVEGVETSVDTAEAVGELVEHSTRTIVLASDYGLSLQFHGNLSSVPWPLASDLEWERLANQPVLPAVQRFEEGFLGEQPDFFVVMEPWELEQQRDLKAFLIEAFPLLERSDRFAIFDLRRSRG